MAEFCLECFNRLNHMELTEREVTLTEYDDLCEGCGRFLPVVEALEPEGFFARRKRLKRERDNGREQIEFAVCAEQPSRRFWRKKKKGRLD